MSSERRTSARILTAFDAVLRDPRGGELDARAVAHDISEKGFRAETQARLKAGEDLSFALELPGGAFEGRGRVVWVQATQVALWVGIEFVGLDRARRKRLIKLSRPTETDWEAIVDRAWRALLVMTTSVLLWSALESAVWREVLGSLFPTVVATIAAGWALLVLLRGDR